MLEAWQNVERTISGETKKTHPSHNARRLHKPEQLVCREMSLTAGKMYARVVLIINPTSSFLLKSHFFVNIPVD